MSYTGLLARRWICEFDGYGFSTNIMRHTLPGWFECIITIIGLLPFLQLYILHRI